MQQGYSFLSINILIFRTKVCVSHRSPHVSNLSPRTPSSSAACCVLLSVAPHHTAALDIRHRPTAASHFALAA